MGSVIASAPRFVLDPTSERTPAERARLARPASLHGVTVGLLDISKPRGNVFLDRLEQRLTEIGAHVKRYQKPTFTKGKTFGRGLNSSQSRELTWFQRPICTPLRVSA